MNPSILTQRNQFAGERKSLIRKGLDSTVGAGSNPYSPLVPQQLERIITNVMVRLSPELAVIQAVFGAQKHHEFNQLTALPRANGFMGESATTPTYNAQYVRQSLELKILRRKGAVSNFLQDASQGYIDASAAEMENHLQAHAYDLIHAFIYGNKRANKHMFDGLDSMILTNRWNRPLGGSVMDNLKYIDDMIDANMAKQGSNHKKVLLMSPKMQSAVSRLLTNVRLQQGTSAGIGQVEIEGGWRLEAYRGIPILPVASMSSDTTAMTTVTSGGGAQNYAQVSVQTYDGESLASPAVQMSTTLNWTPVAGAFTYKIYVGATATTCKLVAVIPASTYDAAGTWSADVTGIQFASNTIDTTTASTLIAPSGVTALLGGTINIKQANDIPLVATGGINTEQIILWDLDQFQGLGKVPYTNTAGDRFQGLVTMLPLAITDDNIPFMIRSYCALCPSFEATSVISRGWRTA